MKTEPTNITDVADFPVHTEGGQTTVLERHQ